MSHKSFKSFKSFLNYVCLYMSEMRRAKPTNTLLRLQMVKNAPVSNSSHDHQQDKTVFSSLTALQIDSDMVSACLRPNP